MYDYNLMLDDKEDEKVLNILNYVNDTLFPNYETILDILDFKEDNIIICFIDFNMYNAEDELRIIKDVKECLDELNVSYTFDTMPDVEDSGCNYSYRVELKI